MHEVDMTKCLLISLNEWRDRREDTSAMVDTVHLDVGRFTCVEPDQLVTTYNACLLYTSPSPRDNPASRMPSSA